MNLPLSNYSIGLDCSEGELSFVSHAHSDHLNGLKSKENILCTLETKELGGLKGNISSSTKNISLLEAGHMLGSRQLYLEEDGKIITYTGDIRLTPSILFKGAEIKETDELIIEATYGDPSFRFPDNDKVYSEIEKWVKENKDKNLLIGAYEMGKSQEIIKILNQYCSEVPIVNERIAKLSNIYNDFGKKMEFIKVGTEEAEEVMKGPFVAVVPPKHSKKYFASRIANAFNRDTLCAFASGWTLKYKFNVHKGFPLSDHVSFYDIKEYIQQSGAKKVKFFCGDSSYLEKEFKNLL
ncbi:MAG: MBL fold metallo-hydrolase [Candidatus ainarchaeum sp.]|nr:MBL fold metallo-hydrolase [Candidatus ainarchaeum sp.]